MSDKTHPQVGNITSLALDETIAPQPLYSVGVWDTDKQSYVPYRGSVPAFNITRKQLRVAIKELRKLGHSCHRYRDADGSHEDNDWSVLIERTDGKHWKAIRKSWVR